MIMKKNQQNQRNEKNNEEQTSKHYSTRSSAKRNHRLG